MPMPKQYSILRMDCTGGWFILLILSVTAPAALAAGTTSTAAAPAQGSSPSVGDEETLEDIDLMAMEVPVVVTATRQKQKTTAVPYAVGVITQEDIRLAGAQSIPDALRLVPGVDVADLTCAGFAVAPRGYAGMLSRQSLILVDGRQLFDPVFGGTIWGAWPFQLEDIERIEVIRGPGGVTWGANAVNGVINIITKDPRDQKGLTVTGRGGSRGMQKEHLGYAFEENKLRMRVSGEYEGSDGFREGGSILRKLDDNYKTGRMTMHAIYDATSNDVLTLSAGGDLVDGGIVPAPAYGFDIKNPGTQANFLLGKWDHRIADDNRMELTGYVNDFQLSSGAPVIDYRYQQLALQFSHTFKPAEPHTLTWGVDSRLDLVDATNAVPSLLSKSYVDSGTVGLYAQDEWRFAPRWRLTLGGRADYDTYGGVQPSGRAALSYDLTDNAMVYGAVSRAFQMPPAAMRFLDFPLLMGLAHVRSNRDMDPEGIIGYELGYRSSHFDRLKLDGALFCHTHADLATVSPRPGPPGLIFYDHDNRVSPVLYGAEINSSYALTKKLTLLAHYTFQRNEWNSTVPIHEREVLSPAEHKFMVGTRYNVTKRLNLSSHLYYVDDVTAPNPTIPFLPHHIDSYFRLDLRTEYEFWKDRAWFAVGVSNLLDPSHYEGGSIFMNDAEVPRMVFAEIRMNLK